MTNYLKVSKRTDIVQPVSKWKMAGRYEQISRRPLH
jgi:hypothetical protein